MTTDEKKDDSTEQTPPMPIPEEAKGATKVEKPAGCVETPPDEDVDAKPIAPKSDSFNGSLYKNIEKELSGKALSNPDVVRLILADNEKNKQEIERLKKIEDLYYKEQKQIGTFEERNRKNSFTEVLFDFVMGSGGLLIGFCTLDPKTTFTFVNYVLLILGVLLIIGAQLAKRFSK